MMFFQRDVQCFFRCVRNWVVSDPVTTHNTSLVPIHHRRVHVNQEYMCQVRSGTSHSSDVSFILILLLPPSRLSLSLLRHSQPTTTSPPTHPCASNPPFPRLAIWRRRNKVNKLRDKHENASTSYHSSVSWVVSPWLGEKDESQNVKKNCQSICISGVHFPFFLLAWSHIFSTVFQPLCKRKQNTHRYQIGEQNVGWTTVTRDGKKEESSYCSATTWLFNLPLVQVISHLLSKLRVSLELFINICWANLCISSSRHRALIRPPRCDKREPCSTNREPEPNWSRRWVQGQTQRNKFWPNRNSDREVWAEVRNDTFLCGKTRKGEKVSEKKEMERERH